MEIVLASGSPRRRELMERAGYSFAVAAAGADEEARGEPAAVVVELAARKARSIPFDGRPVLAADTLVALDGRALGKPRDGAEAREMLEALSGREHDVFTGVCVRAGREFVAFECTKVRFYALSQADILDYVRSGEPMDKAGAYGIQGGAGRFVQALEGPYDNVMGLPMGLVARLLREAREDFGCR